mgnify:CR=1 FL=1
MISAYCGDIIELVKGWSSSAIVNPANHELVEGGTLCGEIYHHAGAVNLDHDLHNLRGISEGSAVITSGHDLCGWIIHTLAPRYDSIGKWDSLARCYISIAQLGMYLNREAGVDMLAVPAIGTGAFGLDKDKADEVARLSLLKALSEEDRKSLNVCLVFQDSRLNRSRYERMLEDENVCQQPLSMKPDH